MFQKKVFFRLVSVVVCVLVFVMSVPEIWCKESCLAPWSRFSSKVKDEGDGNAICKQKEGSNSSENHSYISGLERIKAGLVDAGVEKDIVGRFFAGVRSFHYLVGNTIKRDPLTMLVVGITNAFPMVPGRPKSYFNYRKWVLNTNRDNLFHELVHLVLDQWEDKIFLDILEGLEKGFPGFMGRYDSLRDELKESSLGREIVAQYITYLFNGGEIAFGYRANENDTGSFEYQRTDMSPAGFIDRNLPQGLKDRFWITAEGSGKQPLLKEKKDSDGKRLLARLWAELNPQFKNELTGLSEERINAFMQIVTNEELIKKVINGGNTLIFTDIPAKLAAVSNRKRAEEFIETVARKIKSIGLGNTMINAILADKQKSGYSRSLLAALGHREDTREEILTAEVKGALGRSKSSMPLIRANISGVIKIMANVLGKMLILVGDSYSEKTIKDLKDLESGIKSVEGQLQKAPDDSKLKDDLNNLKKKHDSLRRKREPFKIDIQPLLDNLTVRLEDLGRVSEREALRYDPAKNEILMDRKFYYGIKANPGKVAVLIWRTLVEYWLSEYSDLKTVTAVTEQEAREIIHWTARALESLGFPNRAVSFFEDVRNSMVKLLTACELDEKSPGISEAVKTELYNRLKENYSNGTVTNLLVPVVFKGLGQSLEDGKAGELLGIVGKQITGASNNIVMDAGFLDGLGEVTLKELRGIKNLYFLGATTSNEALGILCERVFSDSIALKNYFNREVTPERTLFVLGRDELDKFSKALLGAEKRYGQGEMDGFGSTYLLPIDINLGFPIANYLRTAFFLLEAEFNFKELPDDIKLLIAYEIRNLKPEEIKNILAGTGYNSSEDIFRELTDDILKEKIALDALVKSV